jgi:hypothetical protein
MKSLTDGVLAEMLTDASLAVQRNEAPVITDQALPPKRRCQRLREPPTLVNGIT